MTSELEDALALYASNDTQGFVGYIQAGHVLAAEVRRLRDESEGRRVALLAKADEARLEWQRAEQAESTLAAERIENAHLREAFITMERAYNAGEAELDALRERDRVLSKHLEDRATARDPLAQSLIAAENAAMERAKRAEAECIALRERHAVEVEEAFREGFYVAWDGDDQYLVDASWQASEARKRVRREP